MIDPVIRGFIVATAREQFIEAIKGEIERLDVAARRIEGLVPTVSSQLQEQWKSVAECRRSEAEQLRVLLQMAEEEWGLRKSGQSTTAKPPK